MKIQKERGKEKIGYTKKKFKTLWLSEILILNYRIDFLLSIFIFHIFVHVILLHFHTIKKFPYTSMALEPYVILSHCMEPGNLPYR